MWCAGPARGAGGDMCYVLYDISTRGVWATRRALWPHREDRALAMQTGSEARTRPLPIPCDQHTLTLYCKA